MDALDHLESRSIFIIREAYWHFRNIGMLWSIGKDSTTMLWLARKAFNGYCPFPLVHIDTSLKIPEMIAFRDRIVRDWNLRLVVGRNEEALAAGRGPDAGRVDCCHALKTVALQQLMAAHGFTGLLLGIRRDEEGTRAKERYFSPRDARFEWDYKNQPPELWDQFNTSFPPGTHVRIHPLLHWTELEIWQYIERERIPVTDLYFARDGMRYRSLGCAPCTRKIPSTAVDVAGIVAELKGLKTAERAGRAQDLEEPYAFQKLRARGYM